MFTEFLQHCVLNKPECGKMWLEDHMITPIQRIPRYCLLLEQLLKKTNPVHPDHAGLVQSVAEMRSLGTHINAMKKVHAARGRRSWGADGAPQAAESRMRMLHVQNTVKRCPPIIVPARRLVAEFECFWVRLARQCAERARLTSTESQAVPSDPAAAKAAVDGGMPASTPSPGDEGGADAGDAESAVRRRPVSYLGSFEDEGGEYANVLDGDVAGGEREGGNDGDGGGGPKMAMAPNTFEDGSEMTMYLFNDMLLLASHERVSDAWGRARETMKSVKGKVLTVTGNPLEVVGSQRQASPHARSDAAAAAAHHRRRRGGDDPQVRSSWIDRRRWLTAPGAVRYKFRRMEDLDVITVSAFPEGFGLEHGLSVHFPDGARPAVRPARSPAAAQGHGAGPLYYRAHSAEGRQSFLDAFAESFEERCALRVARIESIRSIHGPAPAP